MCSYLELLKNLERQIHKLRETLVSGRSQGAPPWLRSYLESLICWVRIEGAKDCSLDHLYRLKNVYLWREQEEFRRRCHDLLSWSTHGLARIESEEDSWARGGLFESEITRRLWLVLEHAYRATHEDVSGLVDPETKPPTGGIFSDDEFLDKLLDVLAYVVVR